ncbi:MAG TPA: nitrite reductase small subunit NirD [Acidimicrobiia bacterium]|nr:nitrite reductase small subunit NirD [Acidimicrobiia bacterium]
MRGDWVEICTYDAIYPDTGVCALIDGRQVALFRLSNGTLYAVSNHDPFSGANVLSRGIVGDRAGEPKVASPIYKQTFNLRTGVCYEDTTVRLNVYRVRRRRGVVEVFSAPVETAEPDLDDETLDGLGYTRAS